MDRKDAKPKLTPAQFLSVIAFSLGAMIAGYRTIGMPPVVIVGGSSLVGIGLWSRAYCHGPCDPEVILPPFLLTVAMLEVHMIEEYVTGFGPAMSRLFDIHWTESGFLLIFAFIGPVIYALTALGLFWRVRLAGFVACFIFVGPGLAEFTHFLFPLLRPALLPHDPAPITAMPGHGPIAAMPNYWIVTTGHYYFPGLYTAVLPMAPGIYGILAILRSAKRGGKIRSGERHWSVSRR